MNESLKQLFQETGLESYIPLFEEQHLFSEEDFIELTEADYEKIGITKLGDRKRLLKIFSSQNSNSPVTSNLPEQSEVETKTVAIVEAEPVDVKEFGDADWDWVHSDLDGRHLVYRYGTVGPKYCPNCYLKVSPNDMICPNCGTNFREVPAVKNTSENSYTPLASQIPNPVVINNVVNSGKKDSEGSHFSKNFNKSLHGFLGGALGALLGAAIVIIIVLIILSNETISL